MSKIENANERKKKLVDRVGAVMTIKCPRPCLGPLNGKQAITIRGDTNYSYIFSITRDPSIFPCVHLDSIYFHIEVYVRVFLEVTRQENFRKHPFVAVKASRLRF